MRRLLPAGLALAAAVCALLLWLGALWPSAARAYLIDANDARVVPVGTVEAEIQPVGYYGVLLGDEGEYAIAPSLMLYIGLAPGWDLILQGRGYAPFAANGEERYQAYETFIAARYLLREGSYQDEGEGVSTVVQLGLSLPQTDSPTVGLSAALLLAYSFDALTLHFNAWLNFTPEAPFPDRQLNFFFSVVGEIGPDTWAFNPALELYVDYTVGSDPIVSGLVGATAPITDDATFEAGVRVAGRDGYAEVEGRISFYFVWEIAPEASGAGEAEASLPRRDPSTTPQTAAMSALRAFDQRY